jgi:hypothetical protein
MVEMLGSKIPARGAFTLDTLTVTVIQIRGMIDSIILPMAWAVSLGKRPCRSPVMTT